MTELAVIANAVKQSLEPVRSRLEIPALAGMTGGVRGWLEIAASLRSSL